MRRLVLSLALVVALTAPALAYVKPQTAPTLDLTPYGYAITITVFAVNTAIGGVIGVLEYRPGTQDWFLCNQCYTSPETPNFDAVVNAAGGGQPYLETRRPEMNQILSLRYPPIGTPANGLDKINQALASYLLQAVGGVPALNPR